MMLFSFRHFLLESWVVGRKSVITVGRFNQEKPLPPCVQSPHHFLGQNYPKRVAEFSHLEFNHDSSPLPLNQFASNSISCSPLARPSAHMSFGINWKKLDKARRFINALSRLVLGCFNQFFSYCLR